MLSTALLPLFVAGSALAWPSHPRHSSIARALHARQEPVAAPPKAPVAATWFASWHADQFPLSNVSWNKYTTVTYSFGLTTPNVSFVNITDPEIFADFVETAHAHNVSASLSIGGWTGSRFFSPAVATAENRTAFVKTMTDLVKDNNLDGLDFDWEYPGLAGIGCNAVSANDTDNFLAFLTELRAALPNTTLSAATSIKPFISSDLTTPSANVSAFAGVFDYIAIMNYDIWGSWSDTVGPNAPLNDTCAANATQQVGSAVSAVEAWTKAGFPADQIVLGVAGYGHGFSVLPEDGLTADNAISLYAPFNKTSIPAGDVWDEPPAPGATDVCGNPQTISGVWNFWGLVEGGFLNENGTANTAEGIVYKFDECSQTPYVYNKTSGVMVSFDDATSFAAKGQFINATGLRGFAMWEAAGDFDDILLDSIRNAAGFPAVVEDDDETCVDEPDESTSGSGSGSGSGSSSGSGSGSSNGSSSNSGSSNSGSSNSGSSNSGSSNSGSSGSSSGSNSGSTGNSASTGSNNSGSSGSNSGSSGSNTGSSGSTGGSADPDDEYEEYECDDDENPITPTTTNAAAAAPTSVDDEYDDCDEEPETSSPTTPVASADPTTPATGSKPTGNNGGANAAVPTTDAAGASTTTDAAIPEPTADPEDDEECEDEDELETSIIDITSTASTASATPIPITATYTVTETPITTIAATATATESSVTATASATYTTSSVTETESASTAATATTSSVTETASVTESTTATATESETASVTEAALTVSATESVTESATTTSAPESKVPELTSSYETTSEAETTSSAPEPTSTVEATTSYEPAPTTSSKPETTSYEPEPTTSSKPETTSYEPEPIATSKPESKSAEPTTSSTPEPETTPEPTTSVVGTTSTSASASLASPTFK